MHVHSHRDASGYVYAAFAVAAIWLSVVLTSVYAPALVTGSQHEHLRLAALFNWLWGAVATGQVVIAFTALIRRQVPVGRSLWLTLCVGVSGVWLAVLFVSIFGPEFVTGSDPTMLPLAAMISPIVGVFATAFVCRLVQAPPPEPASASANGAPPRQPEAQVAERLRQLAALREANIVTEEEYAAKKAELLARM